MRGSSIGGGPFVWFRTDPSCAAAWFAALTALKRRGSLAKPAARVQGSPMVPLSFASEEFVLTRGRALYWPRERALLVADPHLEQASWYARHGPLPPPCDRRDTAER